MHTNPNFHAFTRLPPSLITTTMLTQCPTHFLPPKKLWMLFVPFAATWLAFAAAVT